MTVIDSTVDEALIRYSVDDVEYAMKQFGISAVGDPAASDVAALIARIQSVRPGRVPTAVDTASILVAEQNNILLVSGDRRVVLDAVSIGVKIRARMFDAPASMKRRIEFYQRVRSALRTIGIKNPHSITGGRL